MLSKKETNQTVLFFTFEIVKFDSLKDIDKNQITILRGAGISLDSPTAIPTVSTFLKILLQCLSSESQLITNQIEKIIQEGTWPRFEVLVNDLVSRIDNQSKITQVFRSKNYNSNHSLIANLIADGAKAVTTNFDYCIENVSDSIRPLIFNTNHLSKEVSYYKNRYNLLKPHGCVTLKDKNELVATLNCLNKTQKGYLQYPTWRRLISEFFHNQYVLVMGYSGSDDFDIMPLLAESKAKAIVWVKHNAHSKKITKTKNDPAINRKLLGQRLFTFEGKLSHISKVFDYTIDSKRVIQERVETKISEYVRSLPRKESTHLNILFSIAFHFKKFDVITDYYSNSKVPLSDLTTFNFIRAFYKSADYSKTVEVSRHFLEAFTKSRLRCEVLHYLATGLYYSGYIEDSLTTINSLQIESKEVSDYNLLMESFIFEAAILVNSGKAELALKRFQIAQEYLVINPNIELEAKIQWGMGSAFTLLDKGSEIEKEYYSKALTIYESLQEDQAISLLNYNLGVHFLSKREQKSTLKHAKAAIQRGRKNTNYNANSTTELYSYLLALQYTITFEDEAWWHELSSKIKLFEDSLLVFPAPFELLCFYILTQVKYNKEIHLDLELFKGLSPYNDHQKLIQAQYFLKYKEWLSKGKLKSILETEKDLIVECC